MEYANFLMAEREPLRKPAAAVTGRDATHTPLVLPAPLVNRALACPRRHRALPVLPIQSHP
jgi:hypothetical protein